MNIINFNIHCMKADEPEYKYVDLDKNNIKEFCCFNGKSNTIELDKEFEMKFTGKTWSPFTLKCMASLRNDNKDYLGLVIGFDKNDQKYKDLNKNQKKLVESEEMNIYKIKKMNGINIKYNDEDSIKDIDSLNKLGKLGITVIIKANYIEKIKHDSNKKNNKFAKGVSFNIIDSWSLYAQHIDNINKLAKQGNEFGIMIDNLTDNNGQKISNDELEKANFKKLSEKTKKLYGNYLMIRSSNGKDYYTDNLSLIKKFTGIELINSCLSILQIIAIAIIAAILTGLLVFFKDRLFDKPENNTNKPPL